VLSNFKEIPQTAKGVETALNRSFAAVRFGRITMQQFQASLQTTAPAANQTGQSFNNLAGTVAFLTRALGASKASVGYARLLQQLTSAKMVEGLKKHGISVRDAAGNYKQLDVIIGEINKKFPKLATGQQSAQNFFKSLSGTTGTIQGQRAFTTLITNVGGYQDILRKTTSDNNEFKKSFDAMNKTAGVVWARSLNILKSLWLELGQAALSTIGDLLKPLEALAKALDGMDKNTKDTIGRLLVLTVAIAGVTGVVLTMVSALGGAVLIFGALEAGPLLAIAGLITGIAVAVMLVIENWDKIKPRLISYWPAVKSAVQSGVEGIAGVLESIGAVITDFFMIADALLRGDWGDLWNAAGEAVGNFGDIVKSALMGVETILQGWLDLVTSGVTGFTVGMVGAGIAAQKLIGVLKNVATAYEAVAAAEATSSVAGARGTGAGLGAGIANMVTNVRIMGMEFSRLRGNGVGTFKSLAGAIGLLAPALGAGGWLAVGLAAVIGSFIVLRSIFGGHVGQQNAFLQQQDEMVQKAHQVTTAIQGEVQALNGLADAAKGVSSARLDRAQAQLDVTTSARAYSQAVKQAHADGKVTTDERLGLKQLKINWDRAKQSAQDASAAFAKAKAHLTDLRGRASAALAQTPADIASSSAQLEARRQRLQNFIENATPATSYQDLLKAKDALDQVNTAIQNLTKGSQQLAATKGAISDYIKAVAPKATADQIQAITNKMVSLGKVLTPKQIRILLNSKSIDDASKKVHQFNRDVENIGKHQRTVKLNVEAKGLSGADKVQLHHAMGIGTAQQAKIDVDPKPAIQHAKQAGDAVRKTGNITAHPKINTQFKPDQAGISAQATTLGTAAKTGVLFGAAGLGDQLGAQMSADVLRAIDQAKSAAQVKSPSKKTAKEIGKPMADGVLKGWKDVDIPAGIAKEIRKATGTTKVKAALKQAMDTAVQTMMDAWDTAKEQAQTNFGDLFSGDTIQTKLDWGAKLNIDDLTKDLADQEHKFRQFNHNLNMLARKGAPTALIDQLRALGPSANAELLAMNGATKKQLNAYFKLYQKSQKDINKATHDAFDEQRMKWTEHGRSLAAGILLGLKQEAPALTRYFQRLWNTLIHDARKHNKSHSPSKLYAQEGRNILDGLRLGMERGAHGLTVPMPGVTSPTGLASFQRGAGGGGVTINQTINAHHSESLQTTMAKANFRLKHRNI